jgi:hypothetical protein
VRLDTEINIPIGLLLSVVGITYVLRRERYMNIPKLYNLKFFKMGSPWQNSLPLGECTRSQVVVFFYSDRWIPIPYFCLSEAIELYHKALYKGKKILVFPTGLKLETKNILLDASSAWILNSAQK